jgi:hypothetical protein
MITLADAAMLFAAGVLLDVIAALYYVAVAKERIVLAAAISFALTEFSYLSYFYVLNGSKLEENLEKLHWYAAGCAVGTFAGLAIGLWKRRKNAEPPASKGAPTGPSVEALVVAAGTSGCTTEQVQAVESGFHKGIVVATNAVVAVENNEGAIEDAEAKLNALAPQSALVQKAIAQAQAAMAAFKANKGTIDEVLAALAVVDQLTAPNPKEAVVARTARKKKQ